MKRYDFNSFEEFSESGTAGEYEALTVITENGWIKADLMTECKSWKTALRRFFKLLDPNGNDPAFEGWYECMSESAENGFFKLNDRMMADGTRNPFPCYAYEIEALDENRWYIFLNVHPGDYPTEPEEETEPTTEAEAKGENTMNTTNTAPAYIISENPQFGSLEITFAEKPADSVRDALKALKFRWNGKRGLWYGFADAETVRAALDGESAPATADRVTETRNRKQTSKPDQDRIRIYYNGIKLNGGELIGCSYSLNNHRDFDKCVTIYAKNYGAQLPRDLLPVKNETDIYTDYFDTDGATITPDHPLYKYFRYAALKSDAKHAERYAAHCEKRINSGGFNAKYYENELTRARAEIDAYKAETDPG